MIVLKQPLVFGIVELLNKSSFYAGQTQIDMDIIKLYQYSFKIFDIAELSRKSINDAGQPDIFMVIIQIR